MLLGVVWTIGIAIACYLFVLGLLALTSIALAGEFCWDPVPGADTYNLYAGTVADPTIRTSIGDDGLPYQWFDNTPGPLTCFDGTTATACIGSVCCAEFYEGPWDFVYYVMTAELSIVPGSESVTSPPVEQCP